ncbi:hypothetical protein E4U22_008277 [Claviceps purpurea]|nr:hypothetical protein E4U22_008277 [Claviceps purpurea]
MMEKEDFHKFVTKFMHTTQKAQLSTRDYVYEFKKRLPYRLQNHLAATPVDQFTQTAAQAHLSLKIAESTNPRGTANRGSGNTTALTNRPQGTTFGNKEETRTEDAGNEEL